MKYLRLQKNTSSVRGWREITRDDAAEWLNSEQMHILDTTFNPIMTRWGSIYQRCTDEMAERHLGMSAPSKKEKGEL